MDDRSQPVMMPMESPHHGYRGETRKEFRQSFLPSSMTLAISREAGARGGTIGRRVGRALNWQVYDQELLEYVMQDNSPVQGGFLDGLPAEAVQWVEQEMERLASNGLELSGSLATMARLSLALGAQGRVVLIGRGAGYILPRASTLHVRLVAPLEDRIAYMSQWLRLTVEEARQRVRMRDARRAEFVTTFLRRQPGDVYSYDLVLNTSSFGEELSTELIVAAARAKEALLNELLGAAPAEEPLP